jgi:hypothetical protein
MPNAKFNAVRWIATSGDFRVVRAKPEWCFWAVLAAHFAYCG